MAVFVFAGCAGCCGAGAECGAVDALVGAAGAGGPDAGVFAFFGVGGFVGVVDGPVAVGFVHWCAWSAHGGSLHVRCWDR